MKSLVKILFFVIFVNILYAQSQRVPLSKSSDFLSIPKAQKFIDMMVKEEGFEREYLETVFRNSFKDEKTLKRYSGRYKAGTTSATWISYKKHLLNKRLVKKARKFKKKYYKTLKKAEQIYDVDINYIVAFIAVESKFGKYTGKYRVIDSLSTLAFYKNRMQKYFYHELKELFLLARDENKDIFSMYGSFAGAMGVVQQMPSIQRRYGVDFNNDGIKDPWNFKDAIGSIANFLHKNGWEKGKVIAVKSNFRGKNFKKLYCSYKSKYNISKLKKLGIKATKFFPYKKAYLLKLRYKNYQEIWLGGKNFGVITKYNHSTNYGMGIYFLANMI